MNKEDTKAQQDEWVRLLESVAVLEKRVAALETAMAGAASALGGAKEATSASVNMAAAKDSPEKIPWLVVSAAVAAVVREPFRIAAIQLQGLPPLNVWAFEGRRAIFYSHSVRSS